MSKRKSTSISDLVGKRTKKPSLDEINKMAEQIHKPKSSEKEIIVKKETTPAPAKPSRSMEGRTKRISLNAPLELYLDIQREATMQGKPMMQYILEVVKSDVDSKK